MKALHFGAGNIGRGFIGLLLHQSGYEINFVDVNNKLIDEINKEGNYRVFLANDQKEEFKVTGVSGLNSQENHEDVITTIASADIVTTAVGPTILPFIAPLIAEGIKKRKNIQDAPLNIIACENMIGGSSQLKNLVLEKLNKEEQQWLHEYIGFPDSAVDRIVPNQQNEKLLDVLVEPFHEWVIDQTGIKGKQPDINEALFVQDLQAYIERKLFTVNTGHAATAYLGYIENVKTIAEAIENKKIKEQVLGTLQETGEVLIKKYGFNEQQHLEYIQKIISRFSNPHIIDDVQRVGRSPIRKLGKNDRLIAPALEYMSLFNKVPTHLVEVMAAALKFYSEEDPESISLQKQIQEKGIRNTLSEIAGLDINHELINSVMDQL